MNGAPVWKGFQSANRTFAYAGLVGLLSTTMEEIMNGFRPANGKFVYLSTASPSSYGSWVIAESDDRSTWEYPSSSWVRRSRESGTWLQPANDTAVRVAVSCGTGSSAPTTVLRCECPTITQNDENRSSVPYDAQRGCSAGAHILHSPVFFAVCARKHADVISHTLTTSQNLSPQSKSVMGRSDAHAACNRADAVWVRSILRHVHNDPAVAAQRAASVARCQERSFCGSMLWRIRRSLGLSRSGILRFLQALNRQRM
jgi:hypothetical protein